MDYVLASKSVLTKIESFDLGEPNILSDHHIISFSLSMCADTDTQAHEAHMYDQFDNRYCWNPEKAESFVKKLSLHESLIEVFEGMKSKLEKSVILSNDIDENLKTFVSTIENVLHHYFCKN